MLTQILFVLIGLAILYVSIKFFIWIIGTAIELVIWLTLGILALILIKTFHAPAYWIIIIAGAILMQYSKNKN